MAKRGSNDRDNDQSSTSSQPSQGSANSTGSQSNNSGNSRPNNSSGYGTSTTPSSRPDGPNSVHDAVANERPESWAYHNTFGGDNAPSRDRDQGTPSVPGQNPRPEDRPRDPARVVRDAKVYTGASVRDVIHEKKRAVVPAKKATRDDKRPHCKSRPKPVRSGRGGGSKSFVPWC